MNLSLVANAHDWALGIPMGWSFVAPNPVVGHVLYQNRQIELDVIAYTIWTAALLGKVEFSRCGDSDYLPLGIASHVNPSEIPATPDQIRKAAQQLKTLGLIWSFDPNNPQHYLDAEPFEVIIQGIPVGYQKESHRYRINHNDGSPALDLDLVSFWLWLEWWRTPCLGQAARKVSEAIKMPYAKVLGHAVGTLLAGMHAGLAYTSLPLITTEV